MVDANKCANYEIAKQCFDEDLEFRVRTRRNRLLGLWAAAELGLSGDRGDNYAKSIVTLGIEFPDDKAIIRQIVGDMRASGASCHEYAVRSEMDRLSRIAALEYAADEPDSPSKAA